VTTDIWRVTPSPDLPGFMLIQELPDDYYGPGYWVIGSQNHDLGDSYRFLSMLNRNLQWARITRIPSSSRFKMLTPSGNSLLFRATKLHPNFASYTGSRKEFPSHGAVWRLTEELPWQLESECVNHGFVPIGMGAFDDLPPEND
jgi:hypothetical protein